MLVVLLSMFLPSYLCAPSDSYLVCPAREEMVEHLVDAY